jgi:hypothetical protein
VHRDHEFSHGGEQVVDGGIMFALLKYDDKIDHIASEESPAVLRVMTAEQLLGMAEEDFRKSGPASAGGGGLLELLQTENATWSWTALGLRFFSLNQFEIALACLARWMSVPQIETFAQQLASSHEVAALRLFCAHMFRGDGKSLAIRVLCPGAD